MGAGTVQVGCRGAGHMGSRGGEERGSEGALHCMSHCIFSRGFLGGCKNGLKYLGTPDKRTGITAAVSGFVSIV
jgi:hypothetical protein